MVTRQGGDSSKTVCVLYANLFDEYAPQRTQHSRQDTLRELLLAKVKMACLCRVADRLLEFGQLADPRSLITGHGYGH